MTHRLWKHAQNYPSILALVGRNHLYGMRHLWHVMVILTLSFLKEYKSIINTK